MPCPRAIMYVKMLSHGMMITNSTHSVFATPPMSLLRKMSPRIHHRHMNQAKKRKNSNSASRNDPLLLNIDSLSLRPVRDGPLRAHDGSMTDRSVQAD